MTGSLDDNRGERIGRLPPPPPSPEAPEAVAEAPAPLPPPPPGAVPLDMDPPPPAPPAPDADLSPDPYVYEQPLAVPPGVHPQSIRAVGGGAAPPAIDMPPQTYRWDFRPADESAPAPRPAPVTEGEASGDYVGYQPIVPIPLHQQVPPPAPVAPARTAPGVVVVLWVLALASVAQTVAIVWLASR